ncbi:MAG TPA: anti-sigma factor [Gaiellaceae bacterium]|nr:anti-sigma factor [Gaiellaceae bacterium]
MRLLRRRRSDEPVELAALADGSLPSTRRAVVEADVAASAELRARLAEQQQALTLTRNAVAAVDAPASLRAALGERRRATPRRLAVAVVAATVATTAALLAVTLTSGSSAEHFRAALAPTGLAPAARGDATLTRRPAGWQIQLEATGLPHLSGGAFYEAWLRDDAGVLVPVGTFDDGRHVTLWAGVAPTRFTTLTVTRERADGDQASSGEKVLVGTVRRTGP